MLTNVSTYSFLGLDLVDGWFRLRPNLPEEPEGAQHWEPCAEGDEDAQQGISPDEFRGGCVLGSTFGAQTPGVWRWPDGLAGVVFERCRFYNCDPPPASSLIGGCEVIAYAPQADQQDWLLDADGAPVQPLDRDLFVANAWSTDPDCIIEARQVGVSEAEVAFDPQTGTETLLPAFSRRVVDFHRVRVL